MSPQPDTSAEQTRQARAMFGRIVRRYDFLNRLMSLGMDRRWRRLAASAAEPAGAVVLDVGAGTGELARELRRQGAARVIAADVTPEMIARGRAKDAAAAPRTIRWLQADALCLPFAAGTFDGVVSAFLLRNLADLPAGFAEMARVLKPGGLLVCLDMTRPRPGPFAATFRLYFHHLVPAVSGRLSGDRAAYHYLPVSLDRHPSAEALAEMLRDAGLLDIRLRRLGLGTMALHVAMKPGAEPRARE